MSLRAKRSNLPALTKGIASSLTLLAMTARLEIIKKFHKLAIKQVMGENRMVQSDILKTLESIKDQVRQKYKAEVKGIFGSYARGEEKENSDIDVLVDFLEGATLFDLSGLGDFLEQKLHCKVDVVSRRALREEIKPYVYESLTMILK